MSHHRYAHRRARSSTPTGRSSTSTTRNVRFVEVDVDTTAYEQSHIPGAVAWNWTSQLSDGVRRDIASREDFSGTAVRLGHRP